MDEIERNRVTEIDLHLRSVTDNAAYPLERAVITGDITKTRLDELVELLHATAGEGMSERDRFLAMFHSGRVGSLSLYYVYALRAKTAAERQQWVNLGLYLRTVFHLCSSLGNFWAFRQQLPDADWRSCNFPFSQVEPPRWIVKRWGPPKQSVSNGDGGSLAPDPVAWATVARPNVWPAEAERLFVLRLGAAREGFFEAQSASELVHRPTGNAS